MSSPPIDESQFDIVDLVRSSPSPPIPRRRSPTNGTELLNKSSPQLPDVNLALENALSDDDPDIQVNGTQEYDNNDSLRSHIEESQLNDRGIESQEYPEPRGILPDEISLPEKPKISEDTFRTSTTTSLNENFLAEPFKRSISTSLENVGDDFTFTPGYIPGKPPKAKYSVLASIEEQPLRSSIEDGSFLATMIKVRGMNGRQMAVQQPTPAMSIHEPENPGTKASIKQSVTPSDISSGDIEAHTEITGHKTITSFTNTPQTTAPGFEKLENPSNSDKKNAVREVPTTLSSRSTGPFQKPPVPPFPDVAIHTDETKTSSIIPGPSSKVEKGRVDSPTSLYGKKESRQNAHRTGIELLQPSDSRGNAKLQLSAKTRCGTTHSQKTLSVEKTPRHNVDSTQNDARLHNDNRYKAQSDRSTNTQVPKQGSCEQPDLPSKVHRKRAVGLLAKNDYRLPSVYRSDLSLNNKDIDVELPRVLSPPPRSLSVVSRATTRDEDRLPLPTAVDVFQWGFQMLQEERDQTTNRDIAMRNYDKRIDELTNKYCIANHRMQESIEARNDAEKRVEKLTVGVAFTRNSLNRVIEDYRNLFDEVQDLKAKDQVMSLKFNDYQASNQRREEEIRTHYSQLLREQATDYGKDLEGLQEVEDTLRTELEVRMREFQEQKGMVEQATKHIEEEKIRYNELKDQLSAYESNVVEKLNANSTAFNDLAKSYELGQSRFDKKLSTIQPVRPAEYPTEIANLPSLITSLSSSIKDRLNNVEKNNSESRLAGNEINTQFQAQIEAIRKDQDALNQLNRQVADLRATNDAQSKELDNSRAEETRLRQALLLKDHELAAAHASAYENANVAEDLLKSQERGLKLERVVNALKKQLSEKNDKIKLTDQTNDRMKEQLKAASLNLERHQSTYESSVAREKKELSEQHVKNMTELTAQMNTQIQKQKDDLAKATGERDHLSLQLSTASKKNESQDASLQLFKEQLDSWLADKSAFEERASEVLSLSAPSLEACNDIVGNIRDLPKACDDIVDRIKSLESRVEVFKRTAEETTALRLPPAIKSQSNINLGYKRPLEETAFRNSKRQKVQPAKVQTGGLKSSSRSSSKVELTKLTTNQKTGSAEGIQSFAEIETDGDEGLQPKPMSMRPVIHQQTPTKRTPLFGSRTASYAVLKPPQECNDERSRHFSREDQTDSQNSYQPSLEPSSQMSTAQVVETASTARKSQPNTNSNSTSASTKAQQHSDIQGQQGQSNASPTQGEHVKIDPPFSSPPRVNRRRERRNSNKSVSFSTIDVKVLPRRTLRRT